MRWFVLVLFASINLISCEEDETLSSMNGNDAEGGADDDSNGTSGDADGDGDEDSDNDSSELRLDCTGCTAIGSSLDNLACAFDVCEFKGENILLEQDYTSPLGTFKNCPFEKTYEAVAHFGSPTNDLAPIRNGSYALMATGWALDSNHVDPCCNDIPDDPCGDLRDGDSNNDPIFDVVEWKMKLKAPPQARGFSFKYIFFSAEYDEYIGSKFNDKFYVYLEADSTNGGEKTIINFTQCRDPDSYSDFTCGKGDIGCDEGKKYCYIAINTAFSECCWYNNCPDGKAKTNIEGTGFECVDDRNSENIDTSRMGGSSSSWLQTTWVIQPGEEFTLTFHLHDTADSILDSEVILDDFKFELSPDTQTAPVE